ncbi:LysM domain-containing protein [Purpureocillium lavendulum]|uniref:LysM domain-containing protein n=1 Tax=Purpureocillium lavendulum TaxID=1247861 RepID=A0AB34FWT3_9HYPO|nr:LysM domain-containing protein [Purpureocillium lavendulum]
MPRGFNITFLLLAASICLHGIAGAPVHNGPEHDKDTTAGLINATPYRWRRGYMNSYQIHGWENHWPEHIEPGESVAVLVERRGGFHGSDSAAEVRYHLEGVSKPMALQLEYRKGIYHEVWARFMGALSSLNNAHDTEHELGFLRRPGGQAFILAGTEGHFISNDPPQQWMQATLPEVGHLPLRELAMPRSHHAGMWKAVAPIGLGAPGNTLTQDDDLWNQIANGGVRVLDIRATKWRYQFRESHASRVGVSWHGMLGAGVEEMIDIVNRFNREIPGELFIFDVHAEARNADHWMRPLDAVETSELYALLRKLEHRVAVPDDEDITQWPLERFIGNGTPAVLVRGHRSWVDSSDNKDVEFPGGREGFVTDRNFPLRGRWSDKNNVEEMISDQLGHLARNRPEPNTTLYNMEWTLTQDALQVMSAVSSNFIIPLNYAAWRTLYKEFWDGLTDQSYPNWVTMDKLHHNQLKAMCMAINKCLAARKCGSLGGKVKVKGDKEIGGK